MSLTTPLALFCGGDRYNFGDLLFSLVMSHRWRHRYDIRPEVLALRHSDLSQLGAAPTRPVTDWLAEHAHAESRLVVAGGEVLEAEWFLIHRYLLDSRLGLVLRLLDRLLPRPWLNAWSRRCFGSSWTQPFVPEPGPGMPKTWFNSVGGAGLETWPLARRQYLCRHLREAEFVSVRDRQVLAVLQATDPELNLHLAPDSAAWVARQWTPLQLARVAPARFADLTARFPQGYICFQCAHYLGESALREIFEALHTLIRQHGLGLVLIPLGLAAGHEDQILLKTLAERLPEALFWNDYRIPVVLRLLQGARLFAGTSLHGNLISMSYGVPHVGLTHRVTKLAAYLETWGLPPLDRCVEFAELPAQAKLALDIEPEQLTAHADALLNTLNLHLLDMERTLGLEALDQHYDVLPTGARPG
jgi:hypothetical protein